MGMCSSTTAHRALARDGYAILRSGVEPSAIQSLLQDMEPIWRNGSGDILVSAPATGTNMSLEPQHRAIKGLRVLDPHWKLESARRCLFATGILACLRSFYGGRPFLFQSQMLEFGPETVLHRDDAFLDVRPNHSLLGVWIALEDALPGSGRMRFVPRSHRLPRVLFGGMRAHFRPPLDDQSSYDQYLADLRESVDAAGLHEQVLDARAGDVLIWDGRLVHSSEPITSGLTRRTLIGHFCGGGALPGYLDEGRERIQDRRGVHYASGYYC